MKSREHVTTNGRAVFFAATWEDLRKAALSHGWALALHGSLNNDMDIMAMPWDEHASTPEVMISQLCICFTEAAQIEKNIQVSRDKPNGRIVYTLPIWADFYLDVNIMQPSPVSLDTHTAEDRSEDYWADFSHVNDKGERVISEANFKSAIRKCASQESLKARQEAIQECISCFDDVFKIKPEVDNILKIVEAFKEAYYNMKKLKSDSTKPPYEK